MKTTNFFRSISAGCIICTVLLPVGYLPVFSGYTVPKYQHHKIPASVYPATTVTNAVDSNPFSDAFQVAFDAASSGFTTLKGDAMSENNFHTKLAVAAPITATTNIFFRNGMWSFRFNITGALNEEPDYFQLFSATIEQTLNIHRLKYSKTYESLGRTDAPLPSVNYAAPEDIIQINRFVSADMFSDEVIIYHRGHLID